MSARTDVMAWVPPPETRLVLECLRSGRGAADANLLAGLSAADWEALVAEAVRLDVAPLVYYRLKTASAPASLPAGAEQELRRLYLEGSGRNVRLYHALGRVLEGLRSAEIPVVVLKGAHLAQLVYPSLELRPMGDVDLLVRERDRARAETCMLGMGCHAIEEEGAPGEELCSHLCYQTSDQRLLVEVHWDIRLLQSPFTLDVEDLWRRALPATVAGVPVATLSREDLVLHTCMHAAFRHTFEMGLRPLCDLLFAIEHYEGDLDWPTVEARSRLWGAARCVYLTLSLAHRLLGTPVPRSLLRSLEPDESGTRFLAWAERQILDVHDPVGGPLSEGWGKLWAAERLGSKVAVFLQTCFPPPRFLAAKYALPSPSGRWKGVPRRILVYAVYLKDLVGRHGQRAWRLLWREDEAKAWVEREALKSQARAWLAGQQRG